MFRRAALATCLALTGSVSAQYLVKDINGLRTRLGTLGSYPKDLTDIGGKLYLCADDGVHGTELWISEGSAATTVLRDANPGAAWSRPQNFARAGDKVVFTAYTAATGFELFVTDGTAAGTGLLKDIWPGPSQGGPIAMVSLGDIALFSAQDPVHGRELWRTDGTAAGTVLVKDVRPGADSSSPFYSVRHGDKVFFRAFDKTGFFGGLWQSDGTAAGTVPVKEWSLPTAQGVTGQIISAPNHVYFPADDGATGVELWRSDGTAAGTVLVQDIAAGGLSSTPALLRLRGNEVVFTAATPAEGREPWQTTGSGSGAAIILDINPGPATSVSPNNPRAFAVAESLIYLRANDGTHGFELWCSDGSATGTRIVRDINSGPASGVGLDIHPIGRTDRVLFAGEAPAEGRELWISDGTPTRTNRIANLNPGAGSSGPKRFTPSGDRIYFTAYTPTYGIELWAIRYARLGAAAGINYGQACRGRIGMPGMVVVGPPIIGGRFSIGVQNANPGSVAAFLLGASKSNVRLLGGCSILVGSQAAIGIKIDKAGFGEVGFAPPRDKRLVGASLFAQTMIVDPHGAFLGVVSVSDGMQVVIGR